MKKFLLAAVCATALMPSTGNAALVYVGTWQVDDGPAWNGSSIAYTGQDVAALLFGGVASNYAISTIDSNAANVDHMSWVSVWGAGGFSDCTGFPCGRKVAENFVKSTSGGYLNPGDTSAYVSDWARGPNFRNYAFLIQGGAVPEPATWAMMIAGFGLVGAGMRRRQTSVRVTYA